MRHLLALGPLAVVACVASVAPARAQAPQTPVPVLQVAAASSAELHGTVLDERGEPVAGAVVSALGASTVFAVSGRDGRFTFRNLAPGPYLVRAHLQGYVPAHGRITQVTANARNVSNVSLARRDRSERDGAPRVLEAGVGASGAPPDTVTDAGEDGHDHGEVAWRLRHLKRSVLRDAAPGYHGPDAGDSLLGDSVASVGRAVGTSARVATALLAEMPLSAEVNLLTTSSFDRPQDLFAMGGTFPRGVAQIAVTGPAAAGEWSMRGGMIQGDLSSWVLTGAYERTGPATHRYQTGLSYGMQRYLGEGVDPLATVAEGNRNVGSVYAFDDWTISPQIALAYGATYSRYNYIPDQALFSPRVGVTVRPNPEEGLRFHAVVARREMAPGAEEFMPPSSGMWLPPERTFSSLAADRQFTPERLDHLEVAAEHDSVGGFVMGVRAFRQHVDDQLVTMFGVALPGQVPSSLGHYYVGSTGDFEATGWGVSVSREFSEGVRASVDYTQVGARWVGASPDTDALALTAASVLRSDEERVHDLTTTIESVMPGTATRVFVLYKISAAFADDREAFGPAGGARFAVQVNQGLPFLDFGSAQWEMLVAVRNLFREDMTTSSVYDELLVVNPPKRIVGGLTVRF